MNVMKFTMVAIVSLALSACQTIGDNSHGYQLRKSLPMGFKDYGMTVVSNKEGYPTRLGETSMRFEVRAGDCGSDSGWSDCANDRERHEMTSKPNVNGTSWHSWSIFLPEDYPIVYPTMVNLGQFHQHGGHVVWMFQNRRGGLMVDNQTIGSTLHMKRILTDDEMRGKWCDILVHARWTSDPDKGFFDVYVNGEPTPRYEWRGKTQTAGKQVYHKFGIYRSWISRYKAMFDGDDVPTQVVYFDDVNQGRTCAATTTLFDCLSLE